MLRNMMWYWIWSRERDFLEDNPQEREMVPAEETVAPEDIKWEENDDGKIEVRGYEDQRDDSKSVKRLKIPETIDGKQVAIISRGFQGCDSLLSIEIPGCVSVIEQHALCGCPRLEKITVAESNSAYETDDAGVLYNKGKSILIYCPAEVKEISIPGSVRTIEDYAFYDCHKLEKITVDKSNPFYESDDAGVLYNKGKTTLICCPPRCKEASIKIPGSVSIIENCAFFYCESLTSVDIPESITHIEWGAFYGCESLVEIEIPDGLSRIEYDTFVACKSLLRIEIPESVTYIGNRAFNGCESLLSINILGNVTGIEERTFEECISLESVNIPSSVSSIGEEAFLECFNLSSINIPGSVIHIGRRAFMYCANLTSINIPGSVSSIGDFAFSDCHKLEKIIVDESNPVYESDDIGMLYNKGKTTLICCPAGTKETNIEIPEGVSNIRDSFYGCESLESIKIPVSVSNIERNALGECTSLKDVYYAGSREQWDAIEIDMDGNDALESATIHYK